MNIKQNLTNMLLSDLEIELAYHELKVKHIKAQIKEIKGDTE